MLLAAALLTAAAGCADESGDLEVAGHDFEAIERSLTSSETDQRDQAHDAIAYDASRARGSRETFYLAIKKSALDDRWFLSAFMEQHFPDQVAALAASSLGTKVVSFRIQNGMLYVFDVGAGKAWSDVLDPDLIIDAYPIIDERDLRTPDGPSRYVVIDPSRGQSRFNLVSDAFGASQRSRLEIELAFSESFRATSDGAIWQTIFTGYTDQPQDSELPLEPNPFRVSGTLGMSLRKYRESAEYVPFEMAPEGEAIDQEFFFRDEPHVDGQGNVTQVAARWNIHPGMAPIEWLIAPEVAALDESPGFEDIDLVDAFVQGIEGWNDAFGFPVFTARLARPDEEIWQDDKNYVLLDPNPSAGFAFANWRTNPNTGEIRGASVYFSSVFLDPGQFSSDPPDPAMQASALTPPIGQIEWEGVSTRPLCIRSSSPYGRTPGDDRLTQGEKLQRFVGHVLAHEVGHTLSLRHNFKGSLVPPGVSVMDYTSNDDAVALGSTPAAYDVAAVQYLYGLSPDAPFEPFCPDELLDVDPDCQQFDTGENPLDDFHRGEYDNVVAGFLLGFPIPVIALDFNASGLVEYIQTGDETQAMRAWFLAVDQVAAPLPEELRTPAHGGGSNIVMGWLLDRIATEHHPAVEPKILGQARAIARNVDGVRTLELRNQMVDTLKAMQTLPAFDTLRKLRADLITDINDPTVSREQKLIARDLVARIEAAIEPYFE